MRGRPLRPDEHELWQAVVRSVRAMHKPRSPVVADLPPKSEIAPLVPKTVTEPFQLGARSLKIQPKTMMQAAGHLAHAPVVMDKKHHERLIKGKYDPEARLDLHGMTAAQAYPELVSFILNAQSRGLRLVLVITGKGKPRENLGPIPQFYGVLKHELPQWLRRPPLNGAVLQLREAHLKHGGAGACYVYLRRLR